MPLHTILLVAARTATDPHVLAAPVPGPRRSRSP